MRRARERSGGEHGGFFIAEGIFVLRHLLRSRYRIRSLLLTERRLAALSDDLDGLTAPVFVATQEVVNAVSGFHLHRGALGSADRPDPQHPIALVRDAHLIVVGEGLNDHENIGALFRNAAAFGAAALLLDPSSADPLYRRAIRVSMGHVLRLPFARIEWPAGITALRAEGFEVLALTPGDEAQDLRDVPRGAKQALLVGAEGPGLSAAALSLADRRVRIAMSPGVDSLNVATAAAIALHHLARGPHDAPA